MTMAVDELAHGLLADAKVAREGSEVRIVVVHARQDERAVARHVIEARLGEGPANRGRVRLTSGPQQAGNAPVVIAARLVRRLVIGHGV